MTIEDLKIEPEFRDLIPKLTDAEFAQLEKNILEDGRVKEPIVVWNGIIIDGHHRYYILQKHPEIPYKIEEKEFANEHAALAWACMVQLGRRNLSVNDASLLRATFYEEEMKSRGAPIGNANAKKQSSENLNFVSKKPSKKTIAKVAKDTGVSHDTIMHDSWYRKGVMAAEEILPGSKEILMHGDKKIPKYLVEDISKVTPDKQRKAVIALSEGNITKAKSILTGANQSLEKYGLNDSENTPDYTADDLIAEIEASLDKFIGGIKTSIEARADVFDEKSKTDFIQKLEGLFNTKIKNLMEEI